MTLEGGNTEILVAATAPVRGVKPQIAQILDFRRFRTAAITIAGVELSRRIRKGQFNLGELRLDAGSLTAV